MALKRKRGSVATLLSVQRGSRGQWAKQKRQIVSWDKKMAGKAPIGRPTDKDSAITSDMRGVGSRKHALFECTVATASQFKNKADAKSSEANWLQE